jgi:hypothetical protein
MHYPIPANPEEIFALRQRPVNEEMIAVAIAGVVKIARYHGQSLADLIQEVLADDPLLDCVQRQWLSQMVTQAWESLP